MINKVFAGSLAVVVAALLWSLDGTFLRPNLYALPSTLVVFLEHLLGFIVLAPLLIYFRGQLKNITKKQWLTIFWVALFGGALGTTFITKALFLTGFKDISVVILLQKFQPIFAIFLAAIILHERFPRRFYFYALIAIIGGYFTTFRDPFTIASLPQATMIIAGFSLAAAFSWGSSTTFGKYSLKNINYGLLAALRFGFTVLIMIVPALYFYASAIPTATGKIWLTLIVIVFTSGAAGMWLYYYGLKKIPASIATLCELSWPLSAVVFDYFLNHNILSASQIAGALLLLLSVYEATALNRSRTISGTVIQGAGAGAGLGYRTANLLPARAGGLVRGLYGCTVRFEGSVTKDCCIMA
jgi:drug/metabolite transporter (DMT)-like permease